MVNHLSPPTLPFPSHSRVRVFNVNDTLRTFAFTEKECYYRKQAATVVYSISPDVERPLIFLFWKKETTGIESEGGLTRFKHTYLMTFCNRKHFILTFKLQENIFSSRYLLVQSRQWKHQVNVWITVNNKDTRTKHSSVFIVNFEQI